MEFRDLKTQYQRLKPEIDAAIEQALSSARFIQGQQVGELEEQLAAYVGVKHCVSCANGTDALTLALMAHDVGPGDAVFVPDFTYIATAGCASILGATPVFVDIDLQTFNMDPTALEEAVQKTVRDGALKPRAVIPVDLFGLPANYAELLPIAQKHHLLVLEDGAQGFGGSINGKRACSFGDIAATSFFPAKPLGCYGDGGAVFTNDEKTAQRLYSLKRQGASPADKYDHHETGVNSRLDTLQAAVLQVKLQAFAASELEEVNQVAEQYTKCLASCGGIVTPAVPDGFVSSWAQYTVLLPDSGKRAEVQRQLRERGIPTMIYYPKGLHQQPVYRAMAASDERFPHTMEAVSRVLSLPMHPYMTADCVRQAAEALLRCMD